MQLSERELALLYLAAECQGSKDGTPVRIRDLGSKLWYTTGRTDQAAKYLRALVMYGLVGKVNRTNWLVLSSGFALLQDAGLIQCTDEFAPTKAGLRLLSQESMGYWYHPIVEGDCLLPTEIDLLRLIAKLTDLQAKGQWGNINGLTIRKKLKIETKNCRPLYRGLGRLTDRGYLCREFRNYTITPEGRAFLAKCKGKR